jgi:hypothetical protein
MDTLQSGGAPANLNALALKALSQFSDYRGFQPFCSADSIHAIDRANQFLSDAECVTSFMSAAFRDAGTMSGSGQNSEVNTLSGEVVSGAMDAIATLISVAAFMMTAEPAREER